MMHKISLLITLALTALLCAPTVYAQKNNSKPAMTIVIDPGHGGYDPGAVGRLNGKQYRECDITLKVAKKVGQLINSNMPQVKVVYTRTTDKHLSTNKTRDLQARVDIANNADAGLFLSIHCNAAGSSSASGAITLIMGESNQQRNQQKADIISDAYRDDLVDMSDAATAAAVKAYIKTIQFTLLANSRTFANLLEKHYTSSIGHGNRKLLVYGEPLWVLCYTQMPGVLTEIGFMSNQSDLKKLASDSGQDQIARSIFAAFKEYYDIYYGSQPAAPQNDDQDDARDSDEDTTPAAADNAQIGYTIQLCASASPIKPSSSEFKSYRNKVREFVSDGKFKYKYCTGSYTSKAQAEKALKEVHKVFKNAYIVGYNGDTLITQAEARALLDKKK